jgi:hypothetical protein
MIHTSVILLKPTPLWRNKMAHAATLTPYLMSLQELPRIVQSSREFALLGKYRASRQSYELALYEINRFISGPVEDAQKQRWNKVLRELNGEVKIIEDIERQLSAFKTTPRSRQEKDGGHVVGPHDIPDIPSNRAHNPDDPVITAADPDVWAPPTPRPEAPRPPLVSQKKSGNSDLPNWAKAQEGKARVGPPTRQRRGEILRM